MADSPYCSTCWGRTDGYSEVGANPCRCKEKRCEWCGEREDFPFICKCVREPLAGVGSEPPVVPLPLPVETPVALPDPIIPYDLTEDDKTFLRTCKIDPEDQ